jgi:hypothetical protein
MPMKSYEGFGGIGLAPMLQLMSNEVLASLIYL